MTTTLLCTSFPREILVHATHWPKAQQPRLPSCLAMSDPCLCQVAPVLGGEGPAIDPQWTALFSGECGGALAGNGGAGVLYRWGFFVAVEPYNWVEVSSPRLVEPTPWDCSHSRSHQAHPRGSLLVAHGINQSMTTKDADMPTAPSQERTLVQPHPNPPCPLSGFVEITCPCRGRDLESAIHHQVSLTSRPKNLRTKTSAR